MSNNPESKPATPPEPYANWNDTTPIYREVFGDLHKDGTAVEVMVGTDAPKPAMQQGGRTIVLLHVLGGGVRSETRLLQHSTDGEGCGLVLALDGDFSAIALGNALEFAGRILKERYAANHGGQS